MNRKHGISPGKQEFDELLNQSGKNCTEQSFHQEAEKEPLSPLVEEYFDRIYHGSIHKETTEDS